MRGKLYVAGPMNGYEDFNHPLFNRVEQLLLEAGWAIINPASFEPEVDQALPRPVRLSIFLREDIELLATCDGIVLLPGWADSTGSNCELFVAQMLGLTSYVWEDENARPEPHLYANLDLMLDHVNDVNWPGEEA